MIFIFIYKLSHGASAFLRTIIRGYALRHGTKAPWLLVLHILYIYYLINTYKEKKLKKKKSHKSRTETPKSDTGY